MITFRGIKSGPVSFLGFLSLKPYFTIETTAQDKKRRAGPLLMRVKAHRRARRVRRAGAQARINDVRWKCGKYHS